MVFQQKHTAKCQSFTGCFFFTVFAQKRYIKEQFVYFWCVVGQELWEKLTLLGGEG